jgi:hypothetical protein
VRNFKKRQRGSRLLALILAFGSDRKRTTRATPQADSVMLRAHCNRGNKKTASRTGRDAVDFPQRKLPPIKRS